MINKIDILIREARYREALDLILETSESNNESPHFHYLHSLVLLKMDDLSASHKALDKALNLAPYDPDYISQKGVLELLSNRLPESLTLMNKAQNLDPKNPYRYSSRAYVLERLDKIKEAISDYEKAIELDPEDAVAHNNLGLLQEKLGWKEKAEKHFKEADQLSKKDEQFASTQTNNAIPKEEPSKKESRGRKKSRIQIIKSVFTSKEQFRDFMKFVSGVIKNKKS